MHEVSDAKHAVSEQVCCKCGEVFLHSPMFLTVKLSETEFVCRDCVVDACEKRIDKAIFMRGVPCES